MREPKITDVIDTRGNPDKYFLYRNTQVIIDDVTWDALRMPYGEFVKLIIKGKKPKTNLDWRAVIWTFNSSRPPSTVYDVNVVIDKETSDVFVIYNDGSNWKK